MIIDSYVSVYYRLADECKITGTAMDKEAQLTIKTKTT
jgi:hypothetical protein